MIRASKTKKNCVHNSSSDWSIFPKSVHPVHPMEIAVISTNHRSPSALSPITGSQLRWENLYVGQRRLPHSINTPLRRETVTLRGSVIALRRATAARGKNFRHRTSPAAPIRAVTTSRQKVDSNTLLLPASARV